MSRLARILASGQKLSRAERNMASALIPLLLFAPLTIAVARTFPDLRALPVWILAGLLTAFIMFMFQKTYRANRGGLTWRAWAYALRATAFVWTFGGAWVLVTGRTPSKYGSHPVPRSTSIDYFVLALGMWLIARGLTAWAPHISFHRVSQTEQGNR